MKLVKKFLRLLPILILLYSCIINALFVNNLNMNLDVDNTTTSHYNAIYNQVTQEQVQYIAFGSFISNDPLYQFNALGFMDVCDNISYLLSNDALALEEINTPLNVVIYVLVYELYLSLAFIGFDLLNWFLSLGRNLLKKGGKYDD